MNSNTRYLITISSVYLIVLMSSVFYYRSIVKNEKEAFDAAFVVEKPDTIYDGHLQYMLMEEIPTHPFLFEKICPVDWNFYSLKTFQRLSRYYTDAQETWGTILLPEPKDSIVARCKDENVIGNHVYRAPLGYLIMEKPIDVEGELVIHTRSKYAFDRLKDYLRHRDVRDIEYMISKDMKVFESEGNEYYVKYINWWTFHAKNVVGADIEIRNAE